MVPRVDGQQPPCHRRGRGSIATWADRPGYGCPSWGHSIPALARREQLEAELEAEALAAAEVAIGHRDVRALAGEIIAPPPIPAEPHPDEPGELVGDAVRVARVCAPAERPADAGAREQVHG